MQKRIAEAMAFCFFAIFVFSFHTGCSQYETQEMQPTPAVQPPQDKIPPPATAFEGRPPQRREEVKPFKKDYPLGPEDVLQISVLLSPELDRTIRIGLDGYISYPLIGRVFATGLTTYELEQKIAQLLGEKYLKEPQVSIFVAEYKSRWAAVIGGVEEPGVFPLTKPVNTLVELLSRAGGLSKGDQRLAAHKLYVIPARYRYEGMEEPAEEPYLYTISVHELLETGNPALNIEILPGDIIYVPTTEFYFVTGEVENPGAYTLKKKMTVMQALAEAGSFTNIASLKDAQVTKMMPDGSEVTLTVNFKDIIEGKAEDISITGGDVLYVGKSTIKVVGANTKEFAKAITAAAVSGFSAAIAAESVRNR